MANSSCTVFYWSSDCRILFSTTGALIKNQTMFCGNGVLGFTLNRDTELRVFFIKKFEIFFNCTVIFQRRPAILVACFYGLGRRLCAYHFETFRDYCKNGNLIFSILYRYTFIVSRLSFCKAPRFVCIS